MCKKQLTATSVFRVRCRHQEGGKIKLVPIIFRSIVGICLCLGATVQGNSLSRYYSGAVIGVENDGNAVVVTLDCCARSLELAMVVTKGDDPSDMALIAEILAEKPLKCTAFKQADQLGRPDKVTCADGHAGLVSELLFARGLVDENCEFSRNEFGTCT